MCRNIYLIESQEANRGGSAWNMEGVERTTAEVVVHSWRCRLRRALHISVVDEGRCDNDDQRAPGGSGRSGSRLDCMVEIDGARAELTFRRAGNGG